MYVGYIRLVTGRTVFAPSGLFFSPALDVQAEPQSLFSSANRVFVIRKALKLKLCLACVVVCPGRIAIAVKKSVYTNF